MHIEQSLDGVPFSSLFDTPPEKVKVVCPEILPVITGMLQSGLKSSILKERKTDPTEESDGGIWLGDSSQGKQSDSVSGMLQYTSLLQPAQLQLCIHEL